MSEKCEIHPVYERTCDNCWSTMNGRMQYLERECRSGVVALGKSRLDEIEKWKADTLNAVEQLGKAYQEIAALKAQLAEREDK